jgi:hypothetical protein
VATARARVRVDTAAVAAYARTNPAVLRDLSVRMARVEVAAVRQAGKRTGTLVRSRRKTVTVTGGRPKVTLGFYAPHALPHHEGTPPHLIRPRNRRVLRFPGRGGVVFAHQVRHPGTRRNPYLSANLRLAGGRTRIR